MNEDNRQEPSLAPEPALTRRTMLAGLGAAGLMSGLFAFAGRLDQASAAATLPGVPADLPPGSAGVTLTPLVGGPIIVVPGFSLLLVRADFAPGSTIAPHHHAGPMAVWLMSGDIGYTLLEGTDITIKRAATNGTPAPAEPLAPGVEVTLHPGDAFFEQGVVHWARNAGTEPAVLFIAALYKTGEPGTTFVNPEGTPIP